MPLTTNVTPTMIAIATGRSPLTPGSPVEDQWAMWIADALMLIQGRVDKFTTMPVVDQAKLDYVIRESVATHVRHPDDATQVSVTVDGDSTSKTYRSGSGRVKISDEWWTLLGLADVGGRAYDIDTAAAAANHLPWCNLAFGALWCSCGADIAGFPIYELDGWPA